METGKIQEGAQDLTTRLISLKSSEVHEAIDQYFSQTAALDSRYLKVIGRDRLKRQADLFNQGFSKSTLVNKPTVDDDEHTIAFTVKRQVDTSKLFYLVKHIPFVGRLATSDQEMHFDAKITLSPTDQSKKDDSSTLYVSKIWIDSQEKAPLIARLIFNTTQPLHKPIAVVVARVAEIVMDQPNPVSPSGILGLAFHTTGALTGWTIGKLHDAGGSVLSHIPGFQKVSHMVTNPDWLPDSQSQLPDWSNKAMASAVNLGHSAEARARKMGVPVDQARDTFYKAVDEVEQRFHLQSKGQELKNKAEKGAHDLADQVRTTTTSPDIDRGEHERFDGQDEEEEEEEVEDVKTPLGKNKPLAEEPSSQAADDKDAGEEPVNHLADVPTTPLGGHDPLANNAPSYAVAVAEGEETSHDDQVDDHTNDQVDEPADGATTPFGGHDPLASNAASYAKATEKGDHPDKSAAQDSDIPTTPLGGHDPLAANAPSYAKAAEEGAHPETQSNDAPSAGQQAQSETDYLKAGTKQHHQEEEYDGATTPFGGHDPLAAGAPSFAQAAAN